MKRSKDRVEKTPEGKWNVITPIETKNGIVWLRTNLFPFKTRADVIKHRNATS